MIYEISQKAKHLLFTLRFSILTIFVSLFIMTTFFIILVRSVAFSDELAYTGKKLINDVSDEVLYELSSSIKPAEVAGKFTSQLMQNHILKMSQTDLILYTYYLVKTMPLIQGAYWGDEYGNFIYAWKDNNGTVTSDILMRGEQFKHLVINRDVNGNIIKSYLSPDLSFDPRVRPWYVGAKTKRNIVWTDIYRFYPSNEFGISSGSPVFNEKNELIGVFGLDLSFDYLTKFITNQKVSKHGYSFIITAREDLVAYPKREPFTQARTQPNELINVHSIALPLIDKSIDYYKKTKQREFTLKYDNASYLVTYQPVNELSEQGWLVGVIAPVNDFTGFLQRINAITLSICLVILAVGIFVVSSLVTRVVRPINSLVKETEKIREFELEGEMSVNSRIKEIVVLRNSIRAMKKGLRQFQRYVPKILVRQLIESGQDIEAGGVRKDLVVFFSDIENFTSISENMDPNELTKQVCEYFEALTQVIISEKGTIDKYIGDSIMAFWGAPLSVSFPCDRAAIAALRCQERVAELNQEWVKQGRPHFNTRIGMHFGEAIVGSIGSSERLSYTALGDTINTTSRLESINKLYKTRITVSDTVYEKLKDNFVLRLVDQVIVKGKTRPMYIYELLGIDPALLSFDIKAYRHEFDKAFAAYQQRKWDDAIASFEQCLNIYPQDSLAVIFIERCKLAGKDNI